MSVRIIRDFTKVCWRLDMLLREVTQPHHYHITVEYRGHQKTVTLSTSPSNHFATIQLHERALKKWKREIDALPTEEQPATTVP